MECALKSDISDPNWAQVDQPPEWNIQFTRTRTRFNKTNSTFLGQTVQTGNNNAPTDMSSEDTKASHALEQLSPSGPLISESGSNVKHDLIFHLHFPAHFSTGAQQHRATRPGFRPFPTDRPTLRCGSVFSLGEGVQHFIFSPVGGGGPIQVRNIFTRSDNTPAASSRK